MTECQIIRNNATYAGLKGDGMTLDKAYERETEMWNQIFKECTPVDLRKLDLQVEMMFDEVIKTV